MKPVVRFLAVAALVALAACRTEQMASPHTAILTQAQADSLGDVVSADVQSELDAATASSGLGFIPGAPVGPLTANPLFCVPQISPTPPADADSDRVPDSVRITFDNCAVGFNNQDTVRGTIDIVDPTPSVRDRSIKQVFTDFERIFLDRHDHRASFSVNGTREIIRDSSEISQTSTDFRTVYTFANGDSVTDLRNWAIVFTADVPGSIHRDAPLPSGTLTINGSSTVTFNDSTVFSLEVTTPTTLHRDATCDQRPQFDAGKVVAVVTRHGTTATITIAFTACGQFTVTKS
jgi:hypothetical protein